MNGRLVLTGVLAAVGGLLVGAHWASTQPDATGSVDVVAIRKVLEEQDAAWNRGDLDEFMKGYWDDEELTFYSAGDVRKGYKALRERYRQRYQAEGKEMGKLTFSDLDVTPLGDGWAMARGRWRVEMKEETIGGLFTLVLRRTPAGWRIVHDHTSAAEAKKG